MKLFRYTAAGRTGLGLIRPGHDDQFIDLAKLDAKLAAEMTPFYDDATRQRVAGLLAQAPASDFQALSSVQFDLPIAHPPKIVCLGLNYADHAKEGGHARPEYPSFFMRVDTSMTDHQAPIVRPKVSTKLDYEAELAVVIGKPARHLTPDNALDCVFGYSCFNDGSVRDWQVSTTQWTAGKNFYRTGGFGPWMVTADEIQPNQKMTLVTRLNGVEMQRATTDMMIHSIPRQIAYISTFIPLEPGDVIVTGTPGGVGNKRNPQVFMKPGDVAEIEVDAIGILRNTVRDE